MIGQQNPSKLVYDLRSKPPGKVPQVIICLFEINWGISDDSFIEKYIN